MSVRDILYIYSACCYNIILVVALKNTRRITKPLWFCAFNHPLTETTTVHLATRMAIVSRTGQKEEYLCFGLVRKLNKIMATGLAPFPKFDVYSEESSVGTRWKKYVAKHKNLFVGLNIDLKKR